MLVFPMSTYTDVRDFHVRFGHPAPDRPTPLSIVARALRMKLLKEEHEELHEALAAGSMGDIAQECVDLLYVTIGTMVALGLPLDPFWTAVHSANMRKSPSGPRDKPTKPEGWRKPDCEGIVRSLIDSSGGGL